MAAEIVIEDARRVTHDVDGRLTQAHGRLILDDDGLCFVHGWDESADGSGAVVGGTLGGAVGALAVAAAAAASGTAPRDVGREMLANVRGLPPRAQVERIAGSIAIPSNDVEKANVGWFIPSFRVLTKTHGERLKFFIPFGSRGSVRAWCRARAS